MKFKDEENGAPYPQLRLQFHDKLHDKVKRVAWRFDAFCVALKMGEAIVTSISREPEFYENNALETPAFSWHLVDCAIDFKNLHLLYAQQKVCEDWLREECQGSEWELVLSNHGTASHFHVAFRDFSKRKGFHLSRPPKPILAKR